MISINNMVNTDRYIPHTHKCLLGSSIVFKSRSLRSKGLKTSILELGYFQSCLLHHFTDIITDTGVFHLSSLSVSAYQPVLLNRLPSWLLLMQFLASHVFRSRKGTTYFCPTCLKSKKQMNNNNNNHNTFPRTSVLFVYYYLFMTRAAVFLGQTTGSMSLKRAVSGFGVLLTFCGVAPGSVLVPSLKLH